MGYAELRKEQSIKEIEKMSIQERYRCARDKLANEQNEGVVPALLNHLRVHENTRWLVYSEHLPKQIPHSHAANAFNALQMSALHYEIIRLCTFWDPIDLDSRSIPTIVKLADSPGVLECVYDDHFEHYGHRENAYAKDWASKARRRLRDGIRDAKRIETSDMLRRTRNFRDKLAHQLEITSAEKKGVIQASLYGDERRLLKKTITTVSRLYLTLNGTNLDWSNARKIHRRNAEAFWRGVRVNVRR